LVLGYYFAFQFTLYIEGEIEEEFYGTGDNHKNPWFPSMNLLKPIGFKNNLP